MSVRARSISRSRVIRRSNLYPSGEALDPSALLAGLLDSINLRDNQLSVYLTDGEESVSYSLTVFLSKDYEIVGDRVKFGFRRLLIDKLSASLSFEIDVRSDSPT